MLSTYSSIQWERKIVFCYSQREQMNNKNVMKADHSKKKKKNKAGGKKSVILKKHEDSEK